MGLDVSAYKNLTKLENVKYLDGEVYGTDLEPLDWESYDLVPYANPDFPGREEGVEHREVYKAEDGFSFRAGAYSRYNRWRDDLAKLAGYDLGSYEQYGKEWPSYAATAWEAGEGPFYELIHFSDCEGTIGPVVSAKLYEDFKSFQSKIEGHDSWFVETYNDFMKAFEMASQNGAVKFH